MTHTPEQIEAAGNAYRTLIQLERAVLANAYVSQDQVDSMKAHHKALNTARRALSGNMPFADFLSLIGETPVESLDEPANPQSGGGPKDEDEDTDD